MWKSGHNVACKVICAEKDGYAVSTKKDNLPGFLKTSNKLKPGEEVLGVFVCVHNGRILLSQLFSLPPAEDSPNSNVISLENWRQKKNKDK